MKTIKQIADELNTSKTSIRRKMTNDFKSKYTETVGNRIFITQAGEIELKNLYNTLLQSEQTATERNAPIATIGTQCNGTTTPNCTKSEQNAPTAMEQNTYIHVLENELKIKNCQIESMQQNINDLTSALVSSQKSLEHSQALHAGTIQQQLTENTDQPQGEKKSF